MFIYQRVTAIVDYLSCHIASPPGCILSLQFLELHLAGGAATEGMAKLKT